VDPIRGLDAVAKRKIPITALAGCPARGLVSIVPILTKLP